MFDDNDYIKERSILLGQVAEARAREKRVLASSRNLKILLLLSLALLPLSHCWFGKPEKAQLSEKSRAVLMNFREEQLNTNFTILQQLMTPDSTFTYIVQEGDYPESLSKKFYGDTKYAYMIMLDNQIGDDKSLITNDTLVLRHKAETLDKSVE
jgi:nucleoid-associated protein YgaU